MSDLRNYIIHSRILRAFVHVFTLLYMCLQRLDNELLKKKVTARRLYVQYQ